MSHRSRWSVGLVSSEDFKIENLFRASLLPPSSLLAIFDISWHVEASFLFLSLSPQGILLLCVSLSKFSLFIEGHQSYGISVHVYDCILTNCICNNSFQIKSHSQVLGFGTSTWILRKHNPVPNSRDSNRYSYISVYYSFIHNSQKAETVKVSSKLMDKQNVL